MDLDDIFTEGPYTGEQLEDVIEDQLWYVEQLVNDNVEFSDAAYALLKRKGVA